MTARGLTYLPALDGVRAVAVVGVLAFHGGLSWAGGGFLGVDVFFVLSGYLITSLLLAERARTGRIALGEFWKRRAARLLPALLLVVAAVLLGARALLPAEDQGRVRGDGVAALLYVANWRMTWGGDDYFAQTAAPSPLQHTWSLGIEEQFYLVWPLVVVLLVAGGGALALRRSGLWRLLFVCVAGVVVSTALLAALHSAADPARAYYGTDTRGAALMVGAGLAVLLALRGDRPVSRTLRRATVALAVVATAWLGWVGVGADGGDRWLYRGGLLSVALAVAVVLAHVVLVPDGWAAYLLSRRPLVLLGRISYGVYLWHWPVFIAVNAGRTGRTGPELFAIRVLVTLGLAAVSYVLVERPVRTLVRDGRPRVLVGAGLGTLASAVAVVALAPSVGAATGTAAGPLPAAGARDGVQQLEGVEPPPPVSRARRQGPWHHHPRPGREPVVSVFGDSVAWTLVSYLPDVPHLDVRNRTMMGCGVARRAPYRYFGQLYPSVSRDCQDWPRLWARAIAADDPDVAFILVGRWETMDRQLDGRWAHVGQPAFDDYLRSELELAIRTAGAHGARVVLATEPYNRRGERLDGGLFPEDEPERVEAWNALLRDVADDHRRVRIVEFGERLSPDGEFTWSVEGIQVRSDGLHLTPSGVQEWIAPWLVPQLRDAVEH